VDRQAYLVDGHRLETESPHFADAVAAAYAQHARPRCLCLIEGIEMYVARLGDGYIVKRMPYSGSRHAPDCPHYEPPAEYSGLDPLLGTAIVEDPATGQTTLKLGFATSRIGGRATTPAAGKARDSAATDGVKLSLRALLHYLWDEARLTHWKPAFAGKRSWATVRRHLLMAAENKIARGEALRSRLYIPEPFSIEQRDALNARRIAQWSHAVAAPGKPQHLMLLIGEVKEIVPARYGYKAVIKHVPDQAFALDEQLYRRLGRRFDSELALWASADTVHMVVIATFGVSEAGIPTIGEMSLMPVTPQWLPIEDSFERQLVEHLVADGRAFIKGLRYNLHRGQCVATATLTDTGVPGPLLFVAPPGLDGADLSETVQQVMAGTGSAAWVWHAASEALPALPASRTWP
jgi:hypothetical protein